MCFQVLERSHYTTTILIRPFTSSQLSGDGNEGGTRSSVPVHSPNLFVPSTLLQVETDYVSKSHWKSNQMTGARSGGRGRTNELGLRTHSRPLTIKRRPLYGLLPQISAFFCFFFCFSCWTHTHTDTNNEPETNTKRRYMKQLTVGKTVRWLFLVGFF